MAASHTEFFEALKSAGPTRADSVARMEALATFLDSAILIPGTNQRVGFDALIGLIPGVGDVITTALSAYIIWEARQLGLPRWKIARMIGNVALDTTLGAVPLAGDAVRRLLPRQQAQHADRPRAPRAQARSARDRRRGGPSRRARPVSRLLWVFAWIGVALWSLFAFSAYGLLDLFGGLIARNADAFAGNPATVEWLFWIFNGLKNLGLTAILVVWGLVSLCFLAVPWFLDRVRRPRGPAAAAARSARHRPRAGPVPPLRQAARPAAPGARAAHRTAALKRGAPDHGAISSRM